jgi:hypothetical protein
LDIKKRTGSKAKSEEQDRDGGLDGRSKMECLIKGGRWKVLKERYNIRSKFK